MGQPILPPQDPSLRIIFDSIRAPHASDYVTSSPGPLTTMSSIEYRDALWQRLGLFAPIGHCECDPNQIEDPLGLHRLGCRNAAGARTHRHDCMVEVIAKAAVAADPQAFQFAREERLADADDSQSRPGDVAMNLGDGRSLADLTVASPFGAARQTASRLAGSPATAATNAYDQKIVGWRRLLNAHQLDEEQLVSKFQPLALTAMGVWDERSLQWLRRFSDICAAAKGIDSGTAFASLMTSLSVALWRGNSRLMRALQIAPSRDPDVDD